MISFKRNKFKYNLLIIILAMFLISSNLLAENKVYFIEKLKKTYLPPAIYALEKKADLFSSNQAPSAKFNVSKFDLNKDGKDEYIVSNPHNNGAYNYFWRIYEETNTSYRQIGEMGCTSIRITSDITDGYMNLECYTYSSLVEGYLKTYQHFGDEYFFEDQKKLILKNIMTPFKDQK